MEKHMSQQQQQQVDWDAMLRQAGPYPVEAFNFVRDGLTYTIERMNNRCEFSDEDHHIDGRQLCLGLRDFAIEQYGLLAPAVFQHWRICRTEDFGRIVFAMVEHGLMSKTEDDTPEDFRAVFDFREAFSRDQLVARMACR